MYVLSLLDRIVTCTEVSVSGGPLSIQLATLFITMCDDKGNDSKSYKSIITAIDEKKRSSFIGSMMAKFMFSAERIIELEDSQGGTLFIQREIYTGLTVPLFWNKLNGQASSMLNSINAALKKKAESNKLSSLH